MKQTAAGLRKLRKMAAAASVIVALAFTLLPGAAAADATSAAGLVTTSYGALNVRSLPSTSGAVLARLPSGSHVTLISKSGDWWRVEYAPSAYGYVSGDYIRYIAGTYAVSAYSPSGAVSVYGGPGTNYPVSGSLPSGRVALVLSESGGWLKILYNGSATGYIRQSDSRSVMAWPVPASRKINQYFSASHQGVDIGASVQGVPGDAVVAVQYGKVVFSGYLSGYGYVVYINSVHNGQPIQTRYAHLRTNPLVKAGEIVGAGQKIGEMGSSGRSTGVHLHFEVRVRSSFSDCVANSESAPANPLQYTS